ncbi:hypothetical protein ACJJI3_17820 [Microbulbifer sp. ZKSA004]|uniref:hypothetical protein n=1 Tax=Microbulbifer sp. ZKSA004 TaxID=3243389 RepID=UPI004038FBC8
MYISKYFNVALLILSLCNYAKATDLDNKEVFEAYKKDQEWRNELSRSLDKNKSNTVKNNLFSFADEYKNRKSVMQALANGELRTANDFMRAFVILHHTSRKPGGGSFSQENHYIAFLLAKRAYELGHEDGVWALTTSYNRYLLGTECKDHEKYGYHRSQDGTRIISNDKSVSSDERLSFKCGMFDPEPVYFQLGLLEKG